MSLNAAPQSEAIGSLPQIASMKHGRVDKRGASTFGGGAGGCASLIHPTESMTWMVFFVRYRGTGNRALRRVQPGNPE